MPFLGLIVNANALVRNYGATNMAPTEKGDPISKHIHGCGRNKKKLAICPETNDCAIEGKKKFTALYCIT
jgi:hypothetical protein